MVKIKKYRRTKPYTKIGIQRMTCYRCGIRPAIFQWSICADKNTWRPICIQCDIELNSLVLEWVGDKNTAIKIEKYKKLIRKK